METVYLNSSWEYKASNGAIVEIKETELANLIIASVMNGNDGVSNAPCLLTNDSLHMLVTEKLKRDILGENYENDFLMSEEEIKLEDKNFGNY